MNNYLIYLDILFDLTAIILGCILVFSSKDNKLKLSWGICSILVGTAFLIDNIRFMGLPIELLPGAYDLLVIHRMLKWLILVTIALMIPLASLRPGFLTSLRIVLFFIPVMLIITIAGSYHVFNGEITQLTSLQSITKNAYHLDVKLRISIFVLTNIISWAYFIISFAGKDASLKRKTTFLMWIYIGWSVLILLFFTFFSLFINTFLFYTYDFYVASFCIFFSVLFLLYENPFSRIKSIKEKEDDENTKQQPVRLQPLAERVFKDIETHTKADKSFTEAQYSIDDLAGKLGIKSKLIVEAIKSAGFTGFKEYVIFLRIEYFKELVLRQTGKSVKELMYTSGFTTRSNFYRIFQRYENMTPLEYMKQFS